MRKNRIILVLLTVLLVLSVTVCAGAASGGDFVLDDAGLLTAGQWQLLEASAEAVSEEYGIGVYVLTVPDYTAYPGWDVFEMAYTYYHDHTLGLGQGRDGVLLVLSMADRDYALFVYGQQAEYALDPYGQTLLEEAFLDHFYENDWAGGMAAYIETCERSFDKAASGDPVRESYGYVHGIVTVLAFVIAFIVCAVLYAGMRTVRPQAASDYVTAEGLQLTVSNDIFINQIVRVRKRETSSSSGGSGHARVGGGGSGRSGKF